MKNDWNIAKLGAVTEIIKRGIAPKYTENDGLCVICLLYTSPSPRDA